jgi:hypothetical protein
VVIRGPISNISDEYKQWAEKSWDGNHPLAKGILSISRITGLSKSLAKMAFDILTVLASSADCVKRCLVSSATFWRRGE